MKLLKLVVALIFAGSFLSTYSQVHLTQDFEGGTKPEGWTEEMASGNEPWRYRNGGHSPNDNNWTVPPEEEDITRNPPAAYEGTFNAIFFKQGDNNERTKLVTPEMDLLGATALELSFYLCQIPWTFEGVTGWDILRVYYKVSPEAPWVLLHEYLDPVYDWTEQVLTLPNPSQHYYVAFEGQTRWGYGTCIDQVIIKETASQPRYIGEIDFVQSFDNIVPSGATDVPVIQLGMKVFGNTDSVVLDQIRFNSLNSDDSDIQPGGVKLYSTSSLTFSTDHPLGSPTDFVGGVATFSNLDYRLPSGLSYLWLTCDIALDAKHQNILDVMVPANGIVAGDSLYPSSNQSPAGERMIYETRYAEQFEGVHNWTLTGEFEVGTPDGSGGSPGNPNPPGAYSGAKSLGTDLTGLGANPYHYEPGLSSASSYLATSPTIDVEYYKNLNLFFRRYLNLEVWDYAGIEVSKDNGATWNKLWGNDNTYISDFQWILERLPISDNFSRTTQLKIRYRLGPTDGANNYSGWNVDDVFVTGEFISKDVGVSEWIYPLSGSGHTASDSVTVRITNFGGAEIVDPVPVAYSLNGGTSWKVDYMNKDIPVGGSVVFTFPTRVDLSQPGLIPSVMAKTTLPGDQFKANDLVATQIYIVPTYTPPYMEDFEQGEAFWRSQGNQLWEFGTPSGTVINGAASGDNSWVTGLSMKYGDMIADRGQVIFEDGFETELGWSFSGEFERAIPNLGFLPYFANAGYYCIGTDLSGLGAKPYLYENGINPGNAYTATSPAIDVSSFSDLKLEFASWIEIQAGDSVKLEVSPDNGVNWYVLWRNTQGAISEIEYLVRDFVIHDSLSFTDALRFRFSLFQSSAAGEAGAGWNLDDFLLTGDLVTNEPGHLTSPSFDLTGLENPLFEARVWVDTEPGKDGAAIQYSLDDGDTWSFITNSSGYDGYWNWYTGKPAEALGVNGWSGQSGGWMTVRHLLPAILHNQEHVLFRLIFMADKVNNGFDGVALDDVRLMEAPVDIDIMDILAPVSTCELSAQQTFNLRLKNSSIRNLVPGDSLVVGYSIERSGVIQTSEETLHITQNWGSGITRDFNMSDQFDFSKQGDYNTQVYFVTDDPHFYKAVSGDTLSRVIEVNKPDVELGEDISTVRPDTVVLRAFSGVPGQSYLWQDGSTDSTFQVSTDGTYHVRVTNGLGCVTRDTVEVLQLIVDVGISTYAAPLSDCELGDQLPIEIMLKNFGTDTVEIGDTIVVHGVLNQSDHFENLLVLSQRFKPGMTLDFSYSRLFDFSTPGAYGLELYTSLKNDVNPSNDTLHYMLEAYGYPDASLGPDTAVFASEYILQPASGYAQYLWQDGSTAETFTVVQHGLGLYHVTVGDEHLCASSDSVMVTLNVMDLALDQLLAPATSCELSESITVSARIRNTGSVAIPPGETIQLGYRIDGGAIETDGITLSSQLLPGHTLDFVFSKTETVVTGQWYDFTVFVDYSNDHKSLNDTLIQSVGVFEAPLLDLGDDYQVVAAFEHTLDAGPGFASYEWQDGSTAQTFKVTQQGVGLYGVTVTDLNGCSVYDEVQILLGAPDIELLEVAHPVDNCLLQKDEHLRVAIKNNGNWDIDPAAEVSVAYSINGGAAVIESVVLAGIFESGSVLYHTFDRAEDLSVPGTYEIMAYTLFEPDLVPSNDIILVEVDHFGSPVIDIGNGEDTILAGGPVTLTASPGYTSYLWQDGQTTSDYTISDPSAGVYSVLVTAANGCETHDSVFVVYDIPDLGITGIVTPTTSCGVKGESEVSVELVNNGYYRISNQENIYLTYSVNNGSSVIETVMLESDFLPGESRVIPFANKYNFSQAGNYQVQAALIYLADMDGSNNVITDDITIWDSPSVEIGGGQDTIYPGLPTTLDAGSGYTSYLWQDNSAATTFEVTEQGLYWVMVTSDNGCTGVDSVFVDAGTWAGDRTGLPGEVRIYPNPASDVVHVALELDVERAVILELYSITNSLVYREDIKRSMVSEAHIDVRDLTSGTYFLRITTDGIPHNFLVVVE